MTLPQIGRTLSSSDSPVHPRLRISIPQFIFVHFEHFLGQISPNSTSLPFRCKVLLTGFDYPTAPKQIWDASNKQALLTSRNHMSSTKIAVIATVLLAVGLVALVRHGSAPPATITTYEPGPMKTFKKPDPSEL